MSRYNGARPTPATKMNGLASALEAPAAPATRAQRTRFPAEVDGGWLMTLYRLTRFHVSGASVLRWILLTVLLISALFAAGIVPGGIVPALIGVGGAGALYAHARGHARKRFVDFVAEPRTAPAPAPLAVEQKLAAYGTGRFSVEGRIAEFTHLPGFYRSFATREHAILCLRRDQRWLNSARWPEEEVGMWYLFVTADAIRQLVAGKLRVGHQWQAAVAVHYTLTVPPTSRWRRERTIQEVVYLAFPNPADADAALANFLYDRPELSDPLMSPRSRLSADS